MNNVFVLTGYACNGKTTLLLKIKKEIARKTKREVILVPETVEFGFMSNKITGSLLSKEKVDKKLISSANIQQGLFLAGCFAQLSIIRQFFKDSRFIILCDRNFIDVLAFSILKQNISSYKEEIKKIRYDILQYFDIDYEEFGYFYLYPPKSKELVKECLKRKDRAETIGQNIEEYYNNEKRFREIYADLVTNITYLHHPADSQLTEIHLIEEIVSQIKDYEIL